MAWARSGSGAPPQAWGVLSGVASVSGGGGGGGGGNDASDAGSSNGLAGNKIHPGASVPAPAPAPAPSWRGLDDDDCAMAGGGGVVRGDSLAASQASTVSAVSRRSGASGSAAASRLLAVSMGAASPTTPLDAAPAAARARARARLFDDDGSPAPLPARSSGGGALALDDLDATPPTAAAPAGAAPSAAGTPASVLGHSRLSVGALGGRGSQTLAPLVPLPLAPLLASPAITPVATAAAAAAARGGGRTSFTSSPALAGLAAAAGALAVSGVPRAAPAAGGASGASPGAGSATPASVSTPAAAAAAASDGSSSARSGRPLPDAALFECGGFIRSVIAHGASPGAYSSAHGGPCAPQCPPTPLRTPGSGGGGGGGSRARSRIGGLAGPLVRQNSLHDNKVLMVVVSDGDTGSPGSSEARAALEALAASTAGRRASMGALGVTHTPMRMGGAAASPTSARSPSPVAVVDDGAPLTMADVADVTAPHRAAGHSHVVDMLGGGDSGDGCGGGDGDSGGGATVSLVLDRDFRIVRELGAGSFNKVVEVESLADHAHYAVKRTLKPLRSKRDRELHARELRMYARVLAAGGPQRHLVAYYMAWQEAGYMNFQMELCPGGTVRALQSKLPADTALPEATIWAFLAHMASALAAMHAAGVVHLDLKPENVFIAGTAMKLGDLGLSVEFTSAAAGGPSPRHDARAARAAAAAAAVDGATPAADGLDASFHSWAGGSQLSHDDSEGDCRYMAPELLAAGGRAPPADMFSLGVSALELAWDMRLPKEGEPWQALRNGVLPPVDAALGRSPQLVALVTALMAPAPAARPTAAQLLALPQVAAAMSSPDPLLAAFAAARYTMAPAVVAHAVALPAPVDVTGGGGGGGGDTDVDDDMPGGATRAHALGRSQSYTGDMIVADVDAMDAAAGSGARAAAPPALQRSRVRPARVRDARERDHDDDDGDGGDDDGGDGSPAPLALRRTTALSSAATSPDDGFETPAARWDGTSDIMSYGDAFVARSAARTRAAPASTAGRRGNGAGAAARARRGGGGGVPPPPLPPPPAAPLRMPTGWDAATDDGCTRGIRDTDDDGGTRAAHATRSRCLRSDTATSSASISALVCNLADDAGADAARRAGSPAAAAAAATAAAPAATAAPSIHVDDTDADAAGGALSLASPPLPPRHLGLAMAAELRHALPAAADTLLSPARVRLPGGGGSSSGGGGGGSDGSGGSGSGVTRPTKQRPPRSQQLEGAHDVATTLPFAAASAAPAAGAVATPVAYSGDVDILETTGKRRHGGRFADKGVATERVARALPFERLDADAAAERAAAAAARAPVDMSPFHTAPRAGGAAASASPALRAAVVAALAPPSPAPPAPVPPAVRSVSLPAAAQVAGSPFMTAAAAPLLQPPMLSLASGSSSGSGGGGSGAAPVPHRQHYAAALTSPSTATGARGWLVGGSTGSAMAAAAAAAASAAVAAAAAARAGAALMDMGGLRGAVPTVSPARPRSRPQRSDSMEDAHAEALAAAAADSCASAGGAGGSSGGGGGSNACKPPLRRRVGTASAPEALWVNGGTDAAAADGANRDDDARGMYFDADMCDDGDGDDDGDDSESSVPRIMGPAKVPSAPRRRLRRSGGGGGYDSDDGDGGGGSGGASVASGAGASRPPPAKRHAARTAAAPTPALSLDGGGDAFALSGRSSASLGGPFAIPQLHLPFPSGASYVGGGSDAGAARAATPYDSLHTPVDQGVRLTAAHWMK